LSFDQLAAATYALFVEADGPFTVRAEFGPARVAASNVDCASAIDLTGGGTHASNTRAGGLAFDSACTAERDLEPALWYAFTLSEPRRVRVSLSAQWAPLLTLSAGCGKPPLACGAPALDLPAL